MKKTKTYEVSVINKTLSKTYSDQTKFYTSDTALELNFQLKEVEYDFDSAEIILLNIDDRSLVTRPVTKSAEGFTYELEDDIVEHYGEWKGQLKFNEGGEIYVSSPVVFRIENDLNNDRPPQLTDIRDWETLRQSAKDLIAEMGEAVTNEAERVEAEKQREETVANIEARQTSVENQFNSIQQELTDKDPISAPEIIAARGGEPTLSARLDKEQQEVTAQLAQTEHYMNQLQNVFMGKGLEPYWIETAVEFGFTHGGVPEGVNNYEGGNYFLEVSGNEGDEFVTVTGGNITHAGQTISWASVIKDDSGNWKPYRVLGTNGVDQVNIYPPLKSNISNGELANVHDAEMGQHYTERGYFALAQHIYSYSPFYADRNKVISKFNPSTDDLENNKWKHVDTNPTIAVGSVVNSSGILSKEGNNTLYLEGVGGKTLESSYELELKGKKGFVETHVKTGDRQMIVEFYLDGVLVETIEAEPSILNKIKFRFENADSAKLRVYLQNTTSWSGLAIGRTTWYETDEESTTIIPPHSRLVYLGDSWGEFHNRAVSRELSRLLTRDSGTTVEVFNDSVGGMTSKWGMAWFEEYVIKNRPTHVIIEFFTNDLNSISNSLPYDYVAPDGQTYSGEIASREEWLNNIKQLANISKRYGIQPIIVAPALVEGDSQILRHLIASNLMFD